MKVPNWKRLNRKEFTDFPQSVERLFQPLNDQLGKLTELAQRGVTFDDNVAGQSLDINVKNGIETEIQVKKPPKAGELVYADNYPAPLPRLAWRMKGSKTVQFTVYFFKTDMTVDPQGRANVRIEFRV